MPKGKIGSRIEFFRHSLARRQSERTFDLHVANFGNDALVLAQNLKTDPFIVFSQNNRLPRTVNDPHLQLLIFVRQVGVLVKLQLDSDAVGLRLREGDDDGGLPGARGWGAGRRDGRGLFRGGGRRGSAVLEPSGFDERSRPQRDLDARALY